MNVYVVYEERQVSTGCDTEPGNQWSSHEPHENEFIITGVQRTQPDSCYYEEFVVEGEPANVYVIWVRYDTGSTLGRDCGRGAIAGVVLTEQEANAQLDLIESGKHPLSYNWSGYFESLVSSEAQLFPVLGGETKLKRTY
jgi:hypothetical protein